MGKQERSARRREQGNNPQQDPIQQGQRQQQEPGQAGQRSDRQRQQAERGMMPEDRAARQQEMRDRQA
ncbi:hypothetical protein ACFWY6_09005 [Streptomyces sp. NPDC059037]|uniref:hypothetical protein n=1 Tax=Streptomyces sp. NPDC059037 TaxID=3346710 RepID=UPI0036C9A778